MKSYTVIKTAFAVPENSAQPYFYLDSREQQRDRLTWSS